jgi:dTDP-4-dehydrorhamnose reductase
MKIILFGKNGQLGRELQRVLAPFGEVVAVDYQELDLQDSAAVEAFIRLHKPQAIVNASAYTAVDRAEQEQGLAFQVNSGAPGLMAELARSLHAAFIHVSTDYVFDGTLGRPYVETDLPNPLSVYGKSKLAGEQAIQKAGGAFLILRTSWVYSMGGDSFVTKILGWARKNPELRVVDDQIGNPTWARALAEIIGQLLAKAGDTPFAFFEKNAGVYHLAGRGYVSRFDMAKEIIALASVREPGLVSFIQPARTAEFPAPAERPLFSALDCTHFESTFGLRLPEWQDALSLAMREV